MIDLSTWKKAWMLLSVHDKRNAYLVLIVIILSALAAASMVASIMPFLTALANPSGIEENIFLQWVYDYFNFKSDYTFLIGLGAASFLVIVFSSIIQIIRVWLVAHFVTMQIHSISYKLLFNFLSQKYEFFLSRHSAEMSAKILSEASQVVQQFMRPAAELIASSLTALAILSTLVWFSAKIAIISLLILGGAYVIIYLIIRLNLKNLGKKRVLFNKQRFRFANEALSGIKDIKLLGREYAYLERYNKPSILMAETEIKITILSQIPHFTIQAIALGGVILLCLLLIDVNSLASINSILPTLGIFAFAGQRLMPEFSKVYQSLAQLQAGGAAVCSVYKDLVEENKLTNIAIEEEEKIYLNKRVKIENISYNYPESNKSSITNISIEFQKGQKIGVVGSTGAGKTTLVDIILGLIQPNKGSFFVDNEEINYKNVSKWMQNVGYVPQDVFLSDASILENIALGLSSELIDTHCAKKAAKIAQIHEFIVNDLADGYETFIGERGVRLSGGQRQRIGIARALYHDADLIVFDEATSALDNLTEAEVIEAIDALSGNKTVIMVAHRLSTVQRCDKIIILDKGYLVGFDTWDKLKKENPFFQKISLLNKNI
jgi:ATP-binding cassette, subfamily B, bacterial PglK